MGILKAKIEFYRSLATMIDAGVPMVKALRHHYPAPFRRLGSLLADNIEAGGALADGMSRFPGIIEPYEQQLIRAGETTGRLEQILNSLADRHEKRLNSGRNFLGQLIYPLFLYHFASLAIPFIEALISGGGLKGVKTSAVVTTVVMLWAIPYLLYFGAKLFRRVMTAISNGGGMFFDRLMLYLPLVSRLVRKTDYARCFDAIGMALNAGMGMTEAVVLGASVCNNNFIRQTVKNAGDYIEQRNCHLHEALRRFIFPADRESTIMMMLETGEMSGHTAEIAVKIAMQCGEEADYTLGIIANIVPKLIYLAIVLYVAAMILKLGGTVLQKTAAL